jgi:hypothetical protein
MFAQRYEMIEFLERHRSSRCDAMTGYIVSILCLQ